MIASAQTLSRIPCVRADSSSIATVASLVSGILCPPPGNACAHAPAMAEIARCSGVHFGPTGAEAFLSVPEEAFEGARAVELERKATYKRERPQRQAV